MKMVIKKLQKTISIIIILTMVTLIMPTYAIGTPTFTASTHSIYQGETALVQVVLDNLYNVANLSFVLTYDNNAFDVSSGGIVLGTEQELSSLGLSKNLVANRGEIHVTGGNAKGDEEEVEDIDVDTITIVPPVIVATIKFTAKKDAGLGQYPLTFKGARLVSVTGTLGVDAVVSDIPVTKINGSITIKKKNTGGSATGDGLAYYNPTPTPTATPTPTPTTSPDVTSAPTGADSFTDIGSDFDWARASIDALVKEGIISGTSNTTYEPSRDITRAEFCKLIVAAFKLTDVDDLKAYSDVSESDWYYNFVMAAAKAGIVTGYPEGDFKPNASITREEMAAMLVRTYAVVGIPVPTGELTFADANEAGAWAADYIAGLAKMGIVNGREGNKFAPQGKLTRAETAKVIYSSLMFLNALTQ